MRFSLYLSLRLNILCAAPVFYHSIYLKSIWGILCAYDSKLECILECLANECMLNANQPCSTCLLIRLTFRTECFVLNVSGFQFIIIFANYHFRQLPELSKIAQKHSTILDWSFRNFESELCLVLNNTKLFQLIQLDSNKQLEFVLNA